MLARATAASLLALAAAAGGCRRSSHGTLKVAAASDLERAFEEIGRDFQKETGMKVVFAFKSSGLLSQQIGQGAPFDVFASANLAYVDELTRAGACDPATEAPYARGRIVVWTKSDPVASLADLADPKWKKIAIANPDHAPYGKAAREALEKAGVWDQVKPRLVYADNISQTMQWAQEGSADAAITARSLALVQSGGKTLAIDPASYAPLVQAIAVCGKAPPPAARRFVDFVVSPAGRAILERYGFAAP